MTPADHIVVEFSLYLKHALMRGAALIRDGILEKNAALDLHHLLEHRFIIFYTA